jgi:hypothetical protein
MGRAFTGNEVQFTSQVDVLSHLTLGGRNSARFPWYYGGNYAYILRSAGDFININPRPWGRDWTATCIAAVSSPCPSQRR